MQATMTWLKHVAEIHTDAGEFSSKVSDYIADPASFSAVDMAVDDPGRHIFSAVKGAAHGVYRRMGGGEQEKVGVLLFNIYRASWEKNRRKRRRSSCAGR